MKKKVFVGAGLILAALVIIFLALNFGEDNKSGGEISRQDLRRSLDDPTLAFQKNSGFNTEAGDSWRKVLSHYKSWAVYPPNSRPLDTADEYLLDFRRTALAPMPMIVIREGQPVQTNINCLFQPERHTVAQGEKGIFTLDCKRGGRESMAVEITSVSVSRVGEKGPVPARGRTTHGDDGKSEDAKAGDKRYTFTFAPDPRVDAGDMSMDIKFRIPDSESKEFTHEMTAGFYSSPVAPARFTGKTGERLHKGSLVLSVEVDVKKAGYYEITGNLELDDRTPVALARANRTLTAGKHMVELLFFGKIFHDKQAFGSYRLTGLRGRRENPAVSRELARHGSVAEIERHLKTTTRNRGLEKEQIPYTPIVHKTREYHAGDFSNREYDSESKRRRIKLLTNLMENPPE